MDKRHIIKLQGREFVTYEGLLDEAHRQGLQEVRTQLVQIPGPATDHTAICIAEIVLLRDGERRVFTGIGDASPRNVGRNVALHLIRMAETRAKARALRDAVNVGMVAVDELETADLQPEVGDAPIVLQGGGDDRPASKKQIDEVGREMKRIGLTPEEGRAWLLGRFQKQSRLELTASEIEVFAAHLRAQPSADAVA